MTLFTKLTLKKVGPMPALTSGELALVKWSRAALEWAHSTQSTARLTVRFGARLLDIRASRAEILAAHTMGLSSVSNHSSVTSRDTKASLIIARMDEFQPLPNLDGLTFGPYGAIVSAAGPILRAPEGAQDSWLVTVGSETRSVLALEISNRNAILLVGNALAAREIAELARPLLHWLAILDGNVVIHAGAVAQEERGLLVVGAGNSGKTTFVAKCLESGMTFLGDNVVEVSSVESSTAPRLHGAYASLKIRPNSPLKLTTRTDTTMWDHEANKMIHFLHMSPESSLRETAWIKAAVVVGSAFQNTPASITKSETYFAVAPNTVAQFPYFEREVLTRVRNVILRTETYSIGHPEAARIPALAREILQ